MQSLKSKKIHDKDVKEIQKIIRESSSSLALAKNKYSSNTLRNGEYKTHSQPLDLSCLSGILAIDKGNLYALVEPRVTIDYLCKASLEVGLIPQVIPEFRGITVGGAIMGAAIESSSHRFGQFNDSCLEYEVILGDGTLLCISPGHHADLFYAMSGSYGTLAILTLAKIQLMPAKKYVTVTFNRYGRVNEAFSLFRTSQADFLDGVSLSENWIVGMEGFLEDKPSSPLLSQKQFWNKWFYNQIADLTKAGDAKRTLPLRDYLFRFDRGAFWMGRYISHPLLMLKTFFRFGLKTIDSEIRSFAKTFLPQSAPSFFFRLCFEPLMRSSKLYKIWHAVPRQISENLFFVQDFYAPSEKAEEILEIFTKKTGVLPIWLCPVKGTFTPQFLSPHRGKSLFINLGFYGIPKAASIPQLTKELEEEILRFEGKKMLYSLTYYSEETFSKIYEPERYKELRKKFHAEGKFLPLYKKVLSML